MWFPSTLRRMYFYIVVHPLLEHYYIYSKLNKATRAMHMLNKEKSHLEKQTIRPYEVIVVEEGKEIQGIIDYSRTSSELQDEYIYTKAA